ncbi:MAG: hypothetical protein Q4A74_03580 [Cardiobacteriaceae bacterium]|nr:hypothetical protein [Cardiobacteriaceae bacterium]
MTRCCCKGFVMRYRLCHVALLDSCSIALRACGGMLHRRAGFVMRLVDMRCSFVELVFGCDIRSAERGEESRA